MAAKFVKVDKKKKGMSPTDIGKKAGSALLNMFNKDKPKGGAKTVRPPKKKK